MRLPNTFKKIINAPFYRNSFTLASGTFIAQIFLLVISPLLTALYSPEQFGYYGTFLAVTTTVSMIATGRYELAILLPEKDKSGYYIFLLSILLATLFSLLLFALISVTKSSPFWEWTTGLNGLYILLIPLGIFLFSITMPTAFLANRLKKFKLLSLSKITGSGSTGVLSLLFGWMGFSMSGLIVSKLIGWLIETFTILAPLFSKIKSIFPSFEKKRLSTLARQYQNFPKYSTPEGLLNTGFKQIPIFGLAALFSSDLAGFYTLTFVLLSKPFGMVSMSFGHVFYQKATEVQHSTELKAIFSESLRFLFFLAIVPTLILFAIAPQVFGWIYGASWVTSGEYARWLLPFLFVTYLKSPFSGMVDIKNVFVKNLLFEVGFVLIALLAFGIGYWQGDDLLAIKIFSFGNGTLGLFQLYWFRQLIDKKANW